MINIKLIRVAVKNKEFQEFLYSEMKLKRQQVSKLSGCGDCLVDWVNELLPKYLEKVNAHLLKLGIKIPEPQKPLNKKIFKNKAEAIEWLVEQEDFTEIIIGLR